MNKRVDEIFTDCHIAMSDNVRRDMANFFDKVGNVGLRHKRAVSKAEPGGMYLLLKKGTVKPQKEEDNLLTKFAKRVNAEPVPQPASRAAFRARVHQTTSNRASFNPAPPSHRAKIIQPVQTTRVRSKKRKRTMDVTDTTKWVQMKKSAHASEFSSKLRSKSNYRAVKRERDEVKRESEEVYAASLASSEEEEEAPMHPSATHSILSEKIKEVLCRHRDNLNFLTPKKVRREVEALLGYQKGGLDPKKAWMKTKLEEIHKKLLAGDL